MARFDLIDMDYEPDEYVVQRDDGSCYKRFKNYSEARDYYNYLQQLDDQRRSVEQNDEIIANQKRLLEMQAQNNRMPNRPPVTRQVLDPEYQEWLRFKKETDPAYLKWKKEKEAKEAPIRAEKAKRDAELARIRAEREEKEKESHFKSQISYCKAVADKHLLIIEAYEKWQPIVQRIVNEGNGVAAVNLHGGGKEYTEEPYFIKHFLNFKTNYSERWKKACLNIKKHYADDTLSIALKCSFMESELSTLESCHKWLQKSVKFDSYKYTFGSRERIQDGVSRYIGIIVENLTMAKNWRQWGWLFENDLRQRDRSYWEKYQHIYRILEPHLGNWSKDMNTLYYRRYDEDDE